MDLKLTKHESFCKRNNQLPTKSHDELKNNYNVPQQVGHVWWAWDLTHYIPKSQVEIPNTILLWFIYMKLWPSSETSGTNSLLLLRHGKSTTFDPLSNCSTIVSIIGSIQKGKNWKRVFKNIASFGQPYEKLSCHFETINGWWDEL